MTLLDTIKNAIACRADALRKRIAPLAHRYHDETGTQYWAWWSLPLLSRYEPEELFDADFWADYQPQTAHRSIDDELPF